MQQSQASTAYVQVPITAWIDGAPFDPTDPEDFPVEMACITPTAVPEDEDFVEGEWTQNPDGSWSAQTLVGPGEDALDLGVGTYTVWVRITATPEIPVFAAQGLLQIS